MQTLPVSSPPLSSQLSSPQPAANRREGPSAFQKLLARQSASQPSPRQSAARGASPQGATAPEDIPTEINAPDLTQQALTAALINQGQAIPNAQILAAEASPLAAAETALGQPLTTQSPLWQPAPAEAARPDTGSALQVDPAVPQSAPDKLMGGSNQPQTAPAQNSSQFQTLIQAASPQLSQPVVQAQLESEGEIRVLSDDAARPLFQQLEHTPVKVGEAPVVNTQSPHFEDALARPIQKAMAEGAQTLEIKLTPANLGSVTVSLTQNPDGTLHVTLLTMTDKAARLLSEHSGGLMQLLRPGAPAAVQIEVQQSGQGQPGQEDRQSQGQQHSQQQEHKQQQERQGGDDFLQQLRLGLFPLTTEAG